jgi:REP element-mobilizing transposase RayT
MIPKSLFRRRNLPHWDEPGATFFVTGCLEGSIPARGQLDLCRYRDELAARPRPVDVSEADWEVHLWKLGFARLETYLDAGEGTRWLAEPAQAKAVADALRFFAGERYDLISFVIMPTHFHCLFRALPEWVATLPESDPVRSPRERIMYSFRRYSARQCNLLLGRHGTYWQHESYDHWVHDLDELERIIHYIENNPVKARLIGSAVDWEFSSAAVRARLGLSFGASIPKAG